MGVRPRATRTQNYPTDNRGDACQERMIQALMLKVWYYLNKGGHFLWTLLEVFPVCRYVFTILNGKISDKYNESSLTGAHIDVSLRLD